MKVIEWDGAIAKHRANAPAATRAPLTFGIAVTPPTDSKLHLQPGLGILALRGNR